MNQSYQGLFVQHRSHASAIPKIATLYSTCLNYICVNLDVICEPSSASLATLNKSHHHHYYGHHGHAHHHQHSHSQVALQFRQKSIVLNHVISEDLIERLSQLNKLNDSTLSLFVASSASCCLKRLHLRNCVLSKDMLRLVLKNNNIDELSMNNVQIHTPLPPPSVASSQHGTGAVIHAANLRHPEMTANLAHDEMLITSHLSTTPTPNAAASNQSININELVESLNAWSQSNLKSLSVSRDPSLFSSILISNIGKLAASLTRLNVSFTSFNNHSLDLVCQHLPRIEHLDISGTKVNDLAPLTRLRESLKSLHMYHMRASLTDDIVPVVCALFRLTCIDLSCDISTKIFADTSMSLFDVNHFLEELTRARLSELRFLDISGKTGIKKEAICDFLRSYPKLKFFGLALTNANSFDIFINHQQQSWLTSSVSSASLFGDGGGLKPPSSSSVLHVSVSSPALTDLSSSLSTLCGSDEDDDHYFRLSRNLIVTGESNELQVIAALKTYKHRLVYIQKALYHLHILTRCFQETRLDLIELILELMHIHVKSQSVQLTATTCIFSLTRSNMYTSIPAHVLGHVINTILNTMTIYPNCMALQKNCLYILLNEEMLNYCPFKTKFFNKYLCVKATLECLSTFNDQNVINLSIAICSQVALNAGQKYRAQFPKLAEPRYVQKLIVIINSYLQNVTNDSILHSVLDIIWSISENNIDWCCNFITQNGLNIYLNLMDIFENEKEVIMKCLYLIYNLSEIPQIRPILFCHPIANLVKKMLYHEEQKVSFLSVGFFVNLLAYMPDSDWDWHASLINPSRISDFKQELENIIDNWSYDLAGSFFYHHTADSLIKLLQMSDEPWAQTWALWAIYFSFRFYVTSLESARQTRSAIDSARLKEGTSRKVQEMCAHFLDLIENTTSTYILKI